MFTRTALAAAPAESLGSEEPSSMARRKSLCPSWPPESFARRALSTHPRSSTCLSRYMPGLKDKRASPRPPRHGHTPIFLLNFFSFSIAGPQVFGSPYSETSTSAPNGGVEGGRVQAPRLSLPCRRYAKGEWVSRRRYRKQDLRTQTSCLRWILADGRGVICRGGDGRRRRGGGLEYGGSERRHCNSGHLSHQSPGRNLRVS